MRAVLSSIVAALVFALWGAPAEALVVATTQDTTVNPASYPGWNSGDPGWENVTSSGTNYVYLGDSWVLSARHVGVWSATFTVGGETNTFSAIPNQDYIVPNPPGQGLSAITDLRLIRINGDPGLPELTIASTPPSANSQVVIINNGPSRAEDPSYWNVSGTAWTTAAPEDYDHSGFKMVSPRAKRWGTNKISGAGAVLPTGETLTSNRTMVNIASQDEQGNPITLNVMSLVTLFDEIGGTSFETQAGSLSPPTGGDSGGALFYKRNNQWELSGIVDAVVKYPGQSSSWAVYGDATTYVDLSYYHSQIEAIINAHPDYSILGDVNLSGTVVGDGSGDPAADDVAAFVAGWMYDNGTGVGDITSWKNGDLNQDGKTDLADFLVMRGALGAAGSGALASLLGVGSESVPEPSSAAILLLGSALAALRLRRSRRRAR